MDTEIGRIHAFAPDADRLPNRVSEIIEGIAPSRRMKALWLEGETRITTGMPQSATVPLKV